MVLGSSESHLKSAALSHRAEETRAKARRGMTVSKGIRKTHARLSLMERFWTKVDPCRTDGCALWLGALTKEGYGQVYIFGQKKPAYAHYILAGNPPPGLQWDHVKARGCNHRNCVWPEHLEAVTGKVNVLRSSSPIAQHAIATHCPKGHPYDLFNTYLDPRGSRRCRACMRETQLLRQHS